MEIFDNVNKEGASFLEKNKERIANDPIFASTYFRTTLGKFKEGVKESEKVSGQFLDFVKPGLKTMYKDSLIGSFRKMIEFSEGGDYDNIMKTGKEMNRMQLSFFTFCQDNQNVMNEKIYSENDAPKKSYWRMFFRLQIAAFVSIFMFSFFLIILLLPLAPIAMLEERLNKGFLTVISIPFMIVAGFGQVYFWIMWAAYCAFTVRFYVDSPTVTHSWIYYMTGLFTASGPIGWLAHKENQLANSYEERKKIQAGTTYYSYIAIIAFIVFCIWTNLLDYKYFSWLNIWLY